MNVDSKKRRAAASSPGAMVEAVAHALISAPPARGQPAMKARGLGSRLAVSPPGSAPNVAGTYCARSGPGLGGGQTGQGCSPTWAQPAPRTIASQTRCLMWVVYLEMIVALALIAAIVWFTWPRKPK